MDALRQGGGAVVLSLLVLALTTACSAAPLTGDASAAAVHDVLPVMGSSSDRIADGGPDGWTTPQANTYRLPPPAVRGSRGRETLFVRTAAQSAGAPPPPPPPGSTVRMAPSTWSSAAPVTVQRAPQAAYTAPAVPLGTRCWSGCGLPCEDKMSQWHIRGLAGYAIYTGTDAPDPCGYFGFDVGRTFCGCWGIDAYFRAHGCQFDRVGDPSLLTKDGGMVYHVGAKLTYQRSFGGSRFYGFGGIGADYWWTEDFLVTDSGVGPFGELGLGYVLSQNWKIFGGLNLHGLNTTTGRELLANDEDSRWVWVWALVGGIEFSW